MKIYQKNNVWQESLERIEWIFSEFDHVCVSFSGGKDSTIILNLALIVAEKLNRLPIDVLFIDQEAEWQHNIDYIRETIVDNPKINPYWLQVPIQISNGTSHTENWLWCWEEGREWMRPREPGSVHENIYGTTKFYDMFTRFFKVNYPGEKVANLGGVRTEESPTRFVTLTSVPKYKHVTWGKGITKDLQYTFYPIFDWGYRDVWKAICDNDWKYCKIYDFMYQSGYPVLQMRISNLHHETALKSLLFLHEIEPDTWERLSKRLDGVNTVKHLRLDSLTCPKHLPEAFSSWKEYRDYLLEHLIVILENQDAFRKQFDSFDTRYKDMYHLQAMYQVQITALMVNDYHGTKMRNWENKPDLVAYRKWKKYGKLPPVYNIHIHGPKQK